MTYRKIWVLLLSLIAFSLWADNIITTKIQNQEAVCYDVRNMKAQDRKKFHPLQNFCIVYPREGK